MKLLRSSSTPILCSLIEPPHGNSEKLLRTTSIPLNGCKVSLPRDPLPATSHPIKIRRVQSDGNLNAAVPAEHHSDTDSPVRFREAGFTFPWQNKCKPLSKLEPIPSFSFYERDGTEEDADEDDENVAGQEEKFSFPVMDVGNFDQKGTEAAGGFDLVGLLNGKENTFAGLGSWSDLKPTPMYMATGLGIDGLISQVRKSKADDEGMQQHCEKMIKRDYKKAEEFYSGAILAGPEGGEVLSEYAKLRWEVYREEEMSSNYFEQALNLSPQNSHVLAAYASFLWDTDGGEEKDSVKRQQLCYTHEYN